MSDKKLFCCGFFLLSVCIIIGGYLILFVPVMRINGTPVRKYEYARQINKNKGRIISELTDRIMLYQFAEDLGISASDDEIRRASEALLSERAAADKRSAEEMSRQGLLTQKSIEYFAGTLQPGADEIKAYYEQNKDRYGEEPDYESIKQDYTMEKGEQMYENAFEEFKKKADIEIYG